jgi:hypothetical protein
MPNTHQTKLIFVTVLIATILLVGISTAVPTMLPVTSVDQNQAAFSASGGSGYCWFSWGYGTNLYWTTPNQTCSGSFNDVQIGSPLLTGQSYNVEACDDSGCSSPQSFAVPKVVPINATHFGSDMTAIYRSGFNLSKIAESIVDPYRAMMVTPQNPNGGTGVVWGIFFFIIFAGYWLRTKSIVLPSLLALLTGMVIITNSLMVGVTGVGGVFVDPVFVSMGIPLIIIGFAGVFVSWFS